MIDFRHIGLPERAWAIAATLNDYDPTLHLERLPDNHPWLKDNPDRPYAVIHRSPAFPEYIIESYGEDRLDPRIIANTIFGDANRHNWNIEEFDPVTAAYHLVEERRRADKIQEGNDRYAFSTGAKRSY